ncbi:hypothetical protein [Cerasicoccus fimbriatus]|uniref:hypothetical protein n=1 Tax=Cerasicoccus fimbriatus TaxID=3014554 RepID=UPI0022B4CB78|nr:hypothetical protein [Cerasicoccus sp. TK19100]
MATNNQYRYTKKLLLALLSKEFACLTPDNKQFKLSVAVQDGVDDEACFELSLCYKSPLQGWTDDQLRGLSEREGGMLFLDRMADGALTRMLVDLNVAGILLC